MKKVLLLILGTYFFAFTQKLIAQCLPAMYDPGPSCTCYHMVIYSLSLPGTTGTLTDAGNACNSTGYRNLTTLPTCTLMKGSTYTVTLQVGPTYGLYSQTWIDFNNDNVFQPSESVGYPSGAFTNTTTYTITLPNGASVGTGLLRMRVAVSYEYDGAGPPSMDPCLSGPSGTYYYGEARDYFVNVINPPPSTAASPTSLTFGNELVDSTSPAQVFSVTGLYLTGTPITIQAPTGYLLSLTGVGLFTPTVSPTYTVPTLSVTPVYVEFQPTAYSTYTGSVTISGGGAPVNSYVGLSGTGVFMCTGTPVATTAAVTPASGGSGTAFTLSLSPAPTTGGFTYQWYSYSFGTGGFTAIPGAVSATVPIAGISTNTFFYCVVTCTATGLSTASSVVMATFSPAASACTGTPTAGTVAASATAGCGPSYNTNLWLVSPQVGPDITYAWSSSNVSATTGFTAISGATNPYLTATVNNTEWVRCTVTCNSSFVSKNTTAVKLTLNPPPTPISGNPTMCLGNPAAFTSTPLTGNWTSSNTSIVNVGFTSGVASGVVPGMATLTYTIPTTSCFTTQTVSVNPAISVITGSNAVCAGGGTTSLGDLVTRGTWSSSNMAMATVGSTGVVSGISTGSTVITYMLPSGCYSTLPMVINPPPAPIVGTPYTCIGQTSVLTDPTSGGAWSSSNVFQASAGSASGIVTGVASGDPTIMYTLPTGCSSTMTFTVNTLPAAIGGTSFVCAGSSVTLTESTVGGSWSSTNTSLATVDPVSGDVTGVNGGNVNILYTITATGCWASYPITVNAVPNPEPVTETDGGGYCPGGAGVHIGLGGSATGVMYYLWEAGTTWAIDSLLGSVTSLDFGLYTDTGAYTVTAMNLATGCTSNMTGSANVFNFAPPAIHTVGGGGSYCAGGTGVGITLDTSDVGVKYQLYFGGVMSGPEVSGTGGMLTFGPETGMGTYTIVGENLTTLCTSTMDSFAWVYISINPTIDTLNAGGSYCSGGAGVDINLNTSDGGIIYKLFYNSTIVDSMIGSSGLLDFGNWFDSGSYTVTATDFVNNCTSTMYGTANIIINPLPQPYLVNGGGSFCLGGSGRYIGVDYSVEGTNYTLYNAYGPVNTVGGSNSELDFGLQTVSGPYFVVADIVSTNCSDTMPGIATIIANTPPSVYPVLGTSNYCMGGAGVPVSVNGSDMGANFKYQLYLNGVPVHGPMTGTGSTLNFGNQLAAGNYTVIALDTITLCSTTMSGSAVVGIDSLPYIYNVSGGGAFCTGGNGVNIALNNSQNGFNYLLYYNGAYQSTTSSIGGAMTFGPETMPGVYTVVAQNAVTTCSVTMTGSAPVSTLPLPARYAVTVAGGGNYCAPGPGVAVGLMTSNTGVSYQLYKNGTVDGSALLGTGSALNFGNRTDPGPYSVTAINTTTTCNDTMTGSVSVTQRPLPLVFTVSAGGSFCAGTTGLPVSLDTSEGSGVNYQLYNGGILMGSMAASGHMLNFGTFNMGGTYKVVATTSFGCSDTMAGSSLLVASPVPNVFNVTGGGSYCAGDTGVHIFLSGSDTYVDYQVFKGTDSVGSFWAGTGLPLDLGLDTGSGSYRITAINVNDLCTNNMSGSATINVIATVPAGIAISTGGYDTVCAGTMVNYMATPTNGGSSPVFQWKVNGTLAGSGSSYSYTPSNGDSVNVIVTSNARCASPSTATIATLMAVLPQEMPTVTISPTTVNVCPGSSVTFNATPTYGGGTPVYSWKVNGMSYGTTASSYSYTPANGDVVFATLASNYQCSTSSLVLSNEVTVNLNEPPVPVINLDITPVTPLIHAQNATITASTTNTGSNVLSYQWAVNSINVAGATDASFTSSSLNNNDIVCVTIASHNSCGTSSPATQCETMVIYGNTGVAQTGLSGSEIHVVPNPNNGTFNIKGNLGGNAMGNEDVTLEVTNMLGQIVYSNKIVAHNGIINEQVTLTNGIANGMYLLNVRTNGGTDVVHFVVEQ